VTRRFRPGGRCVGRWSWLRGRRPEPGLATPSPTLKKAARREPLRPISPHMSSSSSANEAPRMIGIGPIDTLRWDDVFVSRSGMRGCIEPDQYPMTRRVPAGRAAVPRLAPSELVRAVVVMLGCFQKWRGVVALFRDCRLRMSWCRSLQRIDWLACGRSGINARES